MRILITNDDGISSPVLPHLVKWAQKLGTVVTVAPKTEQSGKSHAIDFTRPIEIKKLEISGCEAYAMDSTPADCVRFATLGLKREFDLVISGINRGFNLGKDIVYSGTVGAIFEAARLGMLGVAISTEPTTFDYALSRLDEVWNFVEKRELLSKNGLYNINIPKGDGDIKITRQGGIYFTDAFIYKGNDMYEQAGTMVVSDSKDLTLDTDCVRNGYVTITPLLAERTNLEVFNSLLNIKD